MKKIITLIYVLFLVVVLWGCQADRPEKVPEGGL